MNFPVNPESELKQKHHDGISKAPDRFALMLKLVLATEAIVRLQSLKARPKKVDFGPQIQFPKRVQRIRAGHALILLTLVWIWDMTGSWALVAASAIGPEENTHMTAKYRQAPPFSADSFLDKISVLVNHRNDASIGPFEFEKMFDIRFKQVQRNSDGMVIYLLKAGDDWYFDAVIKKFPESYRELNNSEGNGPKAEFSIFWKPDAFGEAGTGQCVTAARLRAVLGRSGWLVPEEWGSADYYPPEPPSSDCQQAGAMCPPSVREDFGVHNHVYIRKVVSRTYPGIQVSSNGSLASSCVTGLVVKALPGS